jgi:uncharacterized protein with HEPN domain
VTHGILPSLDEVVAACTRIEEYVSEPSLPADIVHDAVRMRLVDIAVAVGRLPPTITASEPSIPWAQVSGLVERLCGHPGGTPASVLLSTARTDVPALRGAALRMRERCRRPTQER